MDFLQPLVWKQGNFLEPQHFQYIDLHAASIASRLSSRFTPYPWGIHTFDIKLKELSQGVFAVNNLEIMLESGTYISFPQNCVISARSFIDAWNSEQNYFNIYIGVKVISQDSLGSCNDGIIESSKQLKIIKACDLHDAENNEVSELTTANLNANLFWESELDQNIDYDFFKVAVLHKTGSIISLAANHYPALLNVFAYPPAADRLTNIISLLSKESVFFSDILMKYRKSIVLSVDSKALLYMSVCQSIERILAILQQYKSVEYVQPWVLYATLSQAIADSRMLLKEHLNIDLVDYQHINFHDSLSAAEEAIKKIMLALRGDIKHIEQVESIEQEKILRQKEAIYIVKLRALNGYKIKRQESLLKAQQEAALDVQLKALNKIKVAQDQARQRALEAERQKALEQMKETKRLAQGLIELTKFHKQKELAKQEEERRRQEEEALRLEAEKQLELERLEREKQKQREFIAQLHEMNKQLTELNSYKLEQERLAMRKPLNYSFVNQGYDKWSVDLEVNKIHDDRGGIYLVVGSDNPSDKWINDFLSFSKLGARSQIDSYIRYSIAGIELEQVREVPEGVQLQGSSEYSVCFKVLTNSRQWQDAYAEENLVLYAPDTVQEGETLELIITQV